MDQPNLPGEEGPGGPGPAHEASDEEQNTHNRPHPDEIAAWESITDYEAPITMVEMLSEEIENGQLQQAMDRLLNSEDPEERSLGVFMLFQLVGNTEAVAVLSNDLPNMTHHCSVCQEFYLDSDDVSVLSCPGVHHFHTQCIQKWLSRQPTCPLCRAVIVPLQEDPEPA
ncbi:hypothetical protein MJO28_016307 [Puccinia striiformis f. sp. tritici]|uniref:RING-type E3 ubiquitin transferase n=2 Tax=Puccinia striiformis TaxID=27350 RepID=A0A2S4VCD4_9BASI|nr:hypothetical protein Pst134EB_031108 [Puccinia striiformis f. sp. tritici]KAI7935436.1 hypothetical protein MJO28_016307 [Puccinia striiformis f. sp. tritici]KAI9601927.1 hypothetical protein KEM48_001215 [Puccinia striiformis f. sp. tritici PST-130]POW07164.1 hypothetical protein PSHT_10061 [Puccinia striiformis]